ncbi:MAG: Holliday junction branch migration protein RuvA [Succinivibrio sp.]|nr:Holliday junction branch migration protein RuvA [Succinivibrio sp.]
MIGSLRGVVQHIEENLVLLEVGGVGYEVEVSQRDLNQLKIGQETFFYIHHAVREDAENLYGFLEISSRSLFRIMIKISGIGPKVALATLSTFEVSEFVSLVLEDKPRLLTRISGVGAKTAERMVVELRDRLKQFKSGELQSSALPQQLSADVFSEALSALLALGYRQHECLKAIEAIQQPQMNTEAVIVAALAYLSNQKA